MDYQLFHAINSLAGQVDGIDDTFEVLANVVVPIVLAVMLLGLWFWPGERVRRDLRQWACITGVGAAVFGLAVNQVVSRLWDRPRPFEGHRTVQLLAHAGDASFPSDHATVAFAMATAIFLANRRLGIVALLLAALMSFARVYVGIHYFGDVIAGAAIGLVLAVMVFGLRAQMAPVVEPPMRLLRRFHLS